MKKLNKRTVAKPTRPVKILQFGSGNFLRGFVDWMIELMNERSNFNGSVVVVQSHSPSIPKAFLEQDNLYHVLIQGFEKGQVINSHQLVTCIETIINPKLDYESFLKQAENPSLEFIISNTTESGIHFDPLDIPQEGQAPVTFPGMLTAFLFRRFRFFDGSKDKGLSIIPCELIENNGLQLQSAIFDYIRLWDYPEEFRNWIAISLGFHNSLVDRIVPGYPKNNIEKLQVQLGYWDDLLVVAEPFYFWAIESTEKLATRFPALEAGLQVHFVNDLQPYRTRKVKILNGAHIAMVPLAMLQNICTVKDAIEDPEVGKIIHNMIFDEIIPSMDMPNNELVQFANEVLDRFKNPFIRHELSSIALNAISKFKVRILPSMLEYKNKMGKWPIGMIQSFACLIIFYRGMFNDLTMPLKDDSKILEIFKIQWEKSKTIKELVGNILAEKSLWGEDLLLQEGLWEVLEMEIVKRLN